MKSITIIGGGAAGTLFAVNLIKHHTGGPLTINLIETRNRLNRGLAYSTSQDVHLLNVPAGKMGAFPDQIDDFHRWLTAQNLDYAPADFAPRKIYGRYLTEIFDRAVAGKNAGIDFNLIEGQAADIEFGEDSATVILESGERLAAEKVVIAFGNFLPANLPTKSREYLASPKYFRNAYDAEIVDKIAPEDDILLIGTGLTAVDNILSFYHRGHSGKIVMLSTHGWLPAVHAPAALYESFENELKNEISLRKIFKTVRRHTETADNWRAAIDSMRSYTSQLWYNLPPAEKRRFMRHLRRLWDVSRHRIPPECAKICDELQADGRLEIVSGKISDIKLSDNKFTVFYQDHGVEKSLKIDAVINCTGSESNYRRLESPLVQNLLRKEAIKPDDLRMGLAATPEGRLIGGGDQPSKFLWTLSTALKGILYESTAMPEIRTQADQLAVRLLSESD